MWKCQKALREASRSWFSWWWEQKTLHTLWKIDWKFLKKLNIQPLTIGASSAVLGIYPRVLEMCSHRNLYMSVHRRPIHNSPKLERTHVPFCSWMLIINTLWYIHTIKLCATIPMNELQIHTATWADLKGIILSEKSQSQKRTGCMILFV